GRRFVVVVSDEGQEFGVVEIGDGRYGKGGGGRLHELAELERAGVDALLPDPGKKTEVDLEAVASDGNRVLLVGSASLKRKKPKDDSGVNDLAEVVPASGRGNHFSNYAYVLEASAAPGTPPSFKLVLARDLREILLGMPLLAPFREIPSKDNGIDIEGALAHGGFYYFGLRGPVLRGRALVARVRTDFSEPLLFSLDLGGLGVRALSYAGADERTRGVYILAGPTMPTKTDFVLYRWVEHESSTAEQSVKPELVGSVPNHDELAPEALLPLDGALCVVHDGRPGGAPACRALR
ncbi:MAG TPA: DUF3616 domain-containing protein, partial [Polyangiaceae bacterium]